MNFNLGLTFSGVVYTLLIIIIYFKNRRIKTRENKIYSLLLVSTFLELLLGLFGYFSIINISNIPYVTRIINVLYLISLDSWILFFMLYVVSISFDFESKKIYKIFWFVYLTIVFLISVLPIDYYYKDNIMYTSGMAVNFTYLIAVLAVIVIIINSIINIKKLSNKKYIPMFVFLVLGGISLFLQIKYPELFLVSPLEVLVTIVMYFTIENPDMKVIEEIHRAKEISDNANEEKTMFLYNMTNEIRGITRDINKEADIILDETDNKKIDVEVIDNSAREIKGSTARFTTMTNEILDVSSIDNANIKVYDEKYSIKLLLRRLVTLYNDKCKEKNLTFRSDIDSTLPEYLYGDSLGLKNVLTSILDNSVKYTSNGYVELNVSTIIKNNIVRLIITIEDSGIGISPDKLDTIFYKNREEIDGSNIKNNLYTAKKLITLMGGTIIASSNYNEGTTMKIVLDQKLGEQYDEKLTKYENTYDKKRILLVDDNISTNKIISKLLKDTNIELDYVGLGKEALDKIRSKEKYDLILLDEVMDPLDGKTVMKKFKDIRDFNTKVILLTRNNEYEYNEEYLKYGFAGYLLKPINKDKLLEIIDKYL